MEHNEGGQPRTALDGFDAVDRSLIEELQRDGRASYKELAASCHVPEATVRRRVNRLLDSGVINVVGVLNTLASETTINAQLHIGLDRDPEAVAREMAQWPEVTWVALTAGPRPLLVEVVCVGRSGVVDLVRRAHQVDGVTSVQSVVYLKVLKTMYAGPPPGSVLT
ncbi:MAG TPA: Lrp/AsnC family transcriptional regulator [Nocardioides sp.]|nr:Lrp/AsnC family transcriptional regulator [uncultured Nocardioides sp.]HCB03262.1 AsnC family transcriptional regulator [Nocardioides sp.]HRI93990.1 Lrp/AsnC family transcriptional regulator [Nocardioides sp.]HRK44004.1 Lrp/AsnC family transcriptional regulator [Nocardioides sp.]